MKQIFTKQNHLSPFKRLGLLVCMLMFSMQAYSQTPIEGSNLTWKLQDSILTIAGTGDMPDFGYSGSPWYSSQNSIRTVVISDGVTSIDASAFNVCNNLQTVNFNAINCSKTGESYGISVFPSTVTTISIGDNVESIPSSFFSGTNITSITIPESVTSIGYDAFYNCNNLQTVNFNAINCSGTGVFPSSVTTLNMGNNVQKIPDHAFYHCTNLSSVTLPNNITTIGNYAFSSTGLTSIIIPESVISIGESAFSGTGLTSVTIPNGVTNIGDGAFNSDNLISVTVGSGNNYYSSENGVLFDKNKTILILYPIAKTDSLYIMPNSVESIKSSFSYRNNLSSIVLSDKVDTIDHWTFGYCENLTSVTFGESIKFIGELAFRFSYLLTEITIKSATPPKIFNSTFEDTPPTTPVYVPCGATSAYQNAVWWSVFQKIQEAEECSLTVATLANDNSLGSVMGGGKYTANNTAVLIAVPKKGCQFLSWNDGNMENPRTITVTQDSTFTASFISCGSEDLLSKIEALQSDTTRLNARIKTLITDTARLYIQVGVLESETGTLSDSIAVLNQLLADCLNGGAAVQEVEEQEFRIYPNPTNGILHIEGDFSPNSSLEIYDIQGKQRFAKTTSGGKKEEINVSAYESGTYLLRIGKSVYKVIKH